MKIGPFDITYVGFGKTWQQALRRGLKIQAVKDYKSLKDVSLKEAKDFIDAYVEKHYPNGLPGPKYKE